MVENANITALANDSAQNAGQKASVLVTTVDSGDFLVAARDLSLSALVGDLVDLNVTITLGGSVFTTGGGNGNGGKSQDNSGDGELHFDGGSEGLKPILRIIYKS